MRSLLQRAFIFLTAVILCVFLLEGTFRLLGIQAPPRPYEGDEITTTKALTRICHNPRVLRPYHSQRGGCVDYVKNNFGFRNTYDVTENTPRGTFRILALGDSFTHGYGVHLEDTFLYRLEAQLKERFPRDGIEVLNAAVPGDSLRTLVPRYQKNLKAIDSQVLLYGLHLNDFLVFGTSDLASTPMVYNGRFRQYLRSVDYLLYQYELASLSRQTLATILSHHNEFTKGYLETRLRMLKTLASDRGAELFVVIYPVFYKLDRYPFEAIHADIRATLDKLRIGYRDLYPAFRGKKDSDYWIMKVDQHPNEIANAIFTEEVLPEMLALKKRGEHADGNQHRSDSHFSQGG